MQRWHLQQGRITKHYDTALIHIYIYFLDWYCRILHIVVFYFCLVFALFFYVLFMCEMTVISCNEMKKVFCKWSFKCLKWSFKCLTTSHPDILTLKAAHCCLNGWAPGWGPYACMHSCIHAGKDTHTKSHQVLREPSRFGQGIKTSILDIY